MECRVSVFSLCCSSRLECGQMFSFRTLSLRLPVTGIDFKGWSRLDAVQGDLFANYHKFSHSSMQILIASKMIMHMDPHSLSTNKSSFIICLNVFEVVNFENFKYISGSLLLPQSSRSASRWRLSLLELVL